VGAVQGRLRPGRRPRLGGRPTGAGDPGKRDLRPVYADFFGKSYNEGLKLFDRQRANYKVSPEDFARRVKAYLGRQGPGFRLNFFADEVGQFIGQDSKLMLNLQTITESLATLCQGRAWVFVTSQGELRNVLGS